MAGLRRPRSDEAATCLRLALPSSQIYTCVTDSVISLIEAALDE